MPFFIKIPPLLFFLIWSVVLLLLHVDISYLILPLKAETVFLVYSSSLMMLLGYFIIYIPNHSKVKEFNLEKFSFLVRTKNFRYRYNFLLTLWVLCTTIEFFYSKNFPLMAYFGIGPYVGYTSYGIPGFHGIVNAIYFLLINLAVINFILTDKFYFKYSFIFIFSVQTFQMSRMTFVSSLIQILFIYLSVNKLNYKRVVKILFYLILAFWLFGFLGDIRSGRENIILFSQLKINYPEWIPTFPIWIYIYIVTPINNINSNILVFQNGILPFNILSSVLPSFLKSIVNVAEQDNYILVRNVFNVSSLFFPFLLDFGLLVTPLFFFFIGLYSGLIVIFMKQRIEWLLINCIFLYTIVQSIFSSHMLHIVFIFEAISTFFFFRSLKVKYE